MDHHIIAAVSISGISLDVLGGLYLAYDLLGGQHGSVARAAGYIAAALACSALVQHVDHPWSFAIRVGAATGLVTTVGAMVAVR